MENIHWQRVLNIQDSEAESVAPQESTEDQMKTRISKLEMKLKQFKKVIKELQRTSSCSSSVCCSSSGCCSSSSCCCPYSDSSSESDQEWKSSPSRLQMQCDVNFLMERVPSYKCSFTDERGMLVLLTNTKSVTKNFFSFVKKNEKFWNVKGILGVITHVPNDLVLSILEAAKQKC